MRNIRLWLSRGCFATGLILMCVSMYKVDVLWNSWGILFMGAGAFLVNEWYYVDRNKDK